MAPPTIQEVKDRTKPIFEVWEIIYKVGGIIAVLGALWVQFLGPGVQSAVQDWLGISAIEAHLDSLPPPRVTNYNMVLSKQTSECFAGQICTYVISGARTEYGDQCGEVITVSYGLNTDYGRSFNVPSDFAPVRLTRTERDLVIDLDLPAFVRPGTHALYADVEYEHCPGRNEPITRRTPDFPLIVSPPAPIN